MKQEIEQIDPNMDLDNPTAQLSFAGFLQSGVVHVNDVNDSWTLLDKASLVGVPFMVMNWDKNQGLRPDTEYVNVKVLTATNEKFCFNDGGQGIRPVLERWFPITSDENFRPAPMYCPKGLRLSQYTNKDGIQGETYYFA